MKFSSQKTNQFFQKINKEVLNSVIQQKVEYYIPSGSTSFHPLYGEETSDTLFILGDTFYGLVMTEAGFSTTWSDIGYDAEGEIKVFILKNEIEESDVDEIIPGSMFRFSEKLTYRITKVYDASNFSYEFGTGLTNWYKFYIICECQLADFDEVHIQGD